jgi:hypothetical protein
MARKLGIRARTKMRVERILNLGEDFENRNNDNKTSSPETKYSKKSFGFLRTKETGQKRKQRVRKIYFRYFTKPINCFLCFPYFLR